MKQDIHLNRLYSYMYNLVQGENLADNLINMRFYGCVIIQQKNLIDIIKHVQFESNISDITSQIKMFYLKVQNAQMKYPAQQSRRPDWNG